MCEYCSEQKWFCTKTDDGRDADTMAKIIGYAGPATGNEALPHLIVCDCGSCEINVEFLRRITFCPWCGRQLSGEESL